MLTFTILEYVWLFFKKLGHCIESYAMYYANRVLCKYLGCLEFSQDAGGPQNSV